MGAFALYEEFEVDRKVYYFTPGDSSTVRMKVLKR